MAAKSAFCWREGTHKSVQTLKTLPSVNRKGVGVNNTDSAEAQNNTIKMVISY